GREAALDPDRGGQRRAEQLERLHDDRLELDDAPLRLLLPAEREDLANEVRRAVARLLDLPQRLTKRLAGARGRRVLERQVPEGQLHVSDDRREDVVEVVRDASGERAETLEALRAKD